MSYQFLNNNIFKKIRPGPFWAVMYLSWPFGHWIGSNLIFGLMYSATIIALHICSWLFIYQWFWYDLMIRSQTDVSQAIYGITIVARTLNVPVIITAWMIRGRKRVRHFVSAIGTVDERLSKFGVNSSKEFFNFKWLTLILAPFVRVIFVIVEPKVASSKRALQYSKSLEPFIQVYVHDDLIISSYVLYLFAFLTSVVHDRFQMINSLLENISGAEYGDEDITGNERRVTVAEWVATVRELRALHRKLFFAAEKLSKAFGLQILQITFLAMMSVIGDLYNYHVITKLPCGMTAPSVSSFLSRNAFRLFPIFVAAFQGSRTIAQAKHTIIVLQDIIVSDDTLRMEISTFSLQLIHYDFRFSASGFFDIDLSSMQMIVGTVVTYLIILIQIGNLPAHCRRTSNWISHSQNNTTESPDVD